MFRILIACEESQAVLGAIFREVPYWSVDYEIYSCDTQATSGNYPSLHLQEDIFDVLDDGWDLVIGFPPCTHLCAAGARWWPEKRADGRQQAAIDFFVRLAECDAPHIALENPVGIIGTAYRKADQWVHLHWFGESEGDLYTKKTGFWLKDLPPLERKFTHPDASLSRTRMHWVAPGPMRSKTRSKTPPGLATEIARQWVAPLVEAHNTEG